MRRSDKVARLNRLLATFGLPEQTWCCERCAAAALAAHSVEIKHRLHPGEPHTDLPEFDLPAHENLMDRAAKA